LIAALAVSMAARALRWSAALELLRPPQFGLAQRRLGLCGLKLRDGLIEPDLERPRVDDEQRITLVHDLAVPELDRAQGAADLGPQVHAVHRRELAQEASGGLHRLLHRPAYGDLGWRRRGGRRLAAVPDLLPAHGRYDRQDCDDRKRASSPAWAPGGQDVIGGTGAFGDVLAAQGNVVHVLPLDR
jgi:hypothetical protein